MREQCSVNGVHMQCEPGVNERTYLGCGFLEVTAQIDKLLAVRITLVLSRCEFCCGAVEFLLQEQPGKNTFNQRSPSVVFLCTTVWRIKVLLLVSRSGFFIVLFSRIYSWVSINWTM